MKASYILLAFAPLIFAADTSVPEIQDGKLYILSLLFTFMLLTHFQALSK